MEKVNFEVEKFSKDPVLVLSGNNWHEGIIGIIASRIKDKFNKPAVIITLNEDQCKGSARSIYGFDIGTNIINAVQLNILKKGGGHKMAGGFSITKDKIDLFRQYLIKNFNKIKTDTTKLHNIFLDSKIAPSALNIGYYEEIYSLEPFGPGNSEPKFVIENLKLISFKILNQAHIKSILIGKDGSVIKGLAWNATNGPLEPYLTKKNKNKFSIAGKLKKNEWQGKKDIEFIIEDIALN